jgi:hypothetical protein
MIPIFLLLQQLWASPTISTGSNPIVSAAGGSSGTLFVASADQMIVISDVVLSATGNNGNDSSCVSHIQILLSSGDIIGDFRLSSDGYDGRAVGGQQAPSNIMHSFRSGLPVPASETASISISGQCSVSYTISGYYAKP